MIGALFRETALAGKKCPGFLSQKVNEGVFFLTYQLTDPDLNLHGIMTWIAFDRFQKFPNKITKLNIDLQCVYHIKKSSTPGFNPWGWAIIHQHKPGQSTNTLLLAGILLQFNLVLLYLIKNPLSQNNWYIPISHFFPKKFANLRN